MRVDGVWVVRECLGTCGDLLLPLALLHLLVLLFLLLLLLHTHLDRRRRRRQRLVGTWEGNRLKVETGETA